MIGGDKDFVSHARILMRVKNSERHFFQQNTGVKALFSTTTPVLLVLNESDTD